MDGTTKDLRICTAFYLSDRPDPAKMLCWTTNESIGAAALRSWLELWGQENEELERMVVVSTRAERRRGAI